MRVAKLKHACTDGGQYGLNVAASDYVGSGVRLVRTSDLSGGNLTDDLDGIFVAGPVDRRFRLRVGDVLLSRSGTVGRSFLVPASAENATFAGFLVRFRPIAENDSRFLSYVTQSTPFQSQVESDAVVSTIQNFNADRYANIAIPLPSAAVQERIADFLDDQVSRIDQAVVLRRRQMDLLELRLRSWLEARFSIPKAGRAPLKSLVPFITSGPRGWGEYVGDTGWPFLRVTNTVRLGIEVDRRDLATVDAPPSPERERTRTRAGDVLVSITADLGAVALIPPDLADANVSQHVALLRPDPRICDSRWLGWTIQTPMFRSALTTSGDGGTKAGLGLGDVGSLRVPAISLERQGELAVAAADANNRWQQLSAAVAAQIRLLEERKRALITAAVTGEFDVTTASGRGVA